MKHLEQYYRNLSEQLERQIQILEAKLKDKKKGKKEKLADKDYDKDGELETSKEEHKGAVDNAIKKAIAKKKGVIKEGRQVSSGNLVYGGFPRILNEARFSIPANPGEATAAEDDLGTVGIDEFKQLLTSGGNPVMPGMTGRGSRVVPKNIRSEALRHLNELPKIPQGGIPGYGEKHPAHIKAKAAYDFFKTHFPQYGVEDQIKQHYDLA
jgi:hypothetical protein